MEGSGSEVKDLLALCARPRLDAAGRLSLAREALGLSDWDAVVAAAEAHGLAPLVHTHLRAAGVHPPPPAARDLLGLYLRHQQANRIRFRTLAVVLTELAAAGVPVVVLKGAALAHLAYPEPGLRPMSDVDLLLEPEAADMAREVLGDLGFADPAPGAAPVSDKHAVAVKVVDGLPVGLELHHRLLSPRHRGALAPEVTGEPPLTFVVEGVTARGLGPAALLSHLCEHLAWHADVFMPLRLIWMADVVAVAEMYAETIDWEVLRWRQPRTLATLALLDAVIPLSPALRTHVEVHGQGTAPGAWDDFRGWPRASLAEQRRQGKGYGRILRDTFFPSPWWLRLRYGLGDAGPVFWYTAVRHPLDVLQLATRWLRESRRFGG